METITVDWGENFKPEPLPEVDFGEFYGKLSGERFRELYRLPKELSAAVIVQHLKLAGLTVMRELANWRAQQTAATLAEVEQDTVDGESALVLLFERAVFCQAKAEILRETVTVDRRPQAENAAKSADDTEAKFRQFAADAIAAIVGAWRVGVCLI